MSDYYNQPVAVQVNAISMPRRRRGLLGFLFRVVCSIVLSLFGFVLVLILIGVIAAGENSPLDQVDGIHSEILEEPDYEESIDSELLEADNEDLINFDHSATYPNVGQWDPSLRMPRGPGFQQTPVAPNSEINSRYGLQQRPKIQPRRFPIPPRRFPIPYPPSPLPIRYQNGF